MITFDGVLDTFTGLAAYVADANKRIFYWYLLGAVVLAVPAYLCVIKKTTAAARQPTGMRGFIGYLFNPKIWLAPSAKQDYLLLIINRFIRLFIYAPAILLMVPVALFVSNAIESIFGPLYSDGSFLAWSTQAIIATFTIALFIADDFSRFLLHWLLHKVPWLWQFHRVHHSATVLTPFTVYRSHPVESYLYACRMALAQGFVVGLCYYLFGPNLSMFDVLGANVFVFVFNIMGSNLRHSHVWLSWGSSIEQWFISPAQHQIHHSDNPQHFDTNLGSALAIWDRMFGTLVLAKNVKRVRFGVGRGEKLPSSLWQLYWQPFVAVGKSALNGFVNKMNKTTEK